MTLRDFFQYLSDNPLALIAYFIAVPVLALWIGWMDRDKGHESPWKHLYALLIYAVCIPGIFSVALSVYMFLFERGGSILNVNLLTQVVPVLSMLLTLSIIKRNVPFEYIPGLGKLSSLMTLIGAAFALMYLLDRTHIFAFVSIPVHYLLLTVLGLVLAFRFALGRMIG